MNPKLTRPEQWELKKIWLEDNEEVGQSLPKCTRFRPKNVLEQPTRVLKRSLASPSAADVAKSQSRELQSLLIWHEAKLLGATGDERRPVGGENLRKLLAI